MTGTDLKRRNAELYPRVAAGDMNARNEMIEANLPLVTLKADDYILCLPHIEHLKDEMLGEGQLGLVEAAEFIRLGGVPDENVTGYLRAAIQKKIGYLVDDELYTSDRSARRYRNRGDDPPQINKVPDSDFVLSSLGYDPHKEADLLELIVGCCETDEERAIVDLRIKGYVDAEIAKTLDIPLTTTYMLRRELYQRVLATGEVTPES